MDHKYHNTAVENLVESLSFEVEAVPQDNVQQYKSTSHITPVNVKVRVRKKDKSGMQKGTICIPKVARTENHPERIRLASSDQTIMSFNVLMEDPDSMKIKKKNVFGSCLNGTTDDDDDGPYLPKEQASGSKSGHKQKLALSKTAGNQFAPGDVQRKPKKFFGPCKPGGCLDPPFGEDRYSYRPPDTKKASTDHEIDTKIPESPCFDKIVKERPKSPSTNNETDTKTLTPHPFDEKINQKTTKPPALDHTTEKPPRKCPKTENTCPPFDYKVDPTTIPFSGFGSAAQGSNEGPDTFNENEISTKQRKRKSSSDSASTVKVTKIISGISSSVQSVSKEERTKSALEDKESNSIITYAGDEDDAHNDRFNKNRKSSVSTNRTSFDLNAPYYSPPKRDSRDKDVNEKTEKIRRSFEPLGKPQDEHLSDNKDDKQKIMLRMGIEPQNEDTLSTEEHGQPSRKMDENFKNTKYVKRPSSHEPQDNEIDKLKGYVGIPLDNTAAEDNEDEVVFVDSPDDYDNIKPKIYEKDEVGTRGNISKKSDEANEKYKNDNTVTVDKQTLKEPDGFKFSVRNQSNSCVSGTGTGYEDRLYIQPEIDTEDLKNNLRRGLLNQDINSQNDLNIKQTESSKKIHKPSLQSDIYKDYFGNNTSDKDNTDTNLFQTLPIDNQDSQYIEDTIDSKPWDGYKEDQTHSTEKKNSNDIVTLKSGAFFKEISDAESDYKMTDSRSSLMTKKYGGNDNTAAVQTATEKDFSSLIKSPVTKIDINSKDKIHDTDVSTPNSHRIDSVLPKYSDSDGFELGSADYRNRDTGTRKYEEMLTKTGRGSDIDPETRKYDGISEKTGRGSNTDIRSRKYDEISTKTGNDSNTDIRGQKYDETSTRTGNSFNIDIIGQKYDETSTRTGNGLNINIRGQKYDETSRKTSNGSNIDIRAPKYEMLAKKGSGSSMDVRTRKYDEMSAKKGSGSSMDIRTTKFDEMSAKKGSGSSMDIRTRKYDEMSPKTGERSKNLARDISLDLAFQNSFDGTVRVLKTIETPLDSKILADPNVLVIQKRVTLDGEKTQVLIDPDTNMTIQLNRHSENDHKEKDHNVHKGILMSDEHATHSHHHHHHTHPHVTFSSEHLHENLSYLYEKELIPLQNMIKDLKAEIDALAGQHKRKERVMQPRLRPVGHCNGIIIKK